MNLSSLFARRYLVSEKSHSVINIVSRVSSFAVGIPVAAMIILLSVFNGFEGLVKSMYGDFDPDIIIAPAEGKVFEATPALKEKVLSVGGVESLSEVLEDNALLEYRGRQYIAAVRGVDSMYRNVVPLDKLIVEGTSDLQFGEIMQAIVGRGLSYNLGVRPALLDPVSVLVPRRGANFSSILPLDAYRSRKIFPTGIFMLDAETDGRYMLTPIDFMRELLDYPDQSSSLMVRLSPEANPERLAAQISKEIGGEFTVKTRYQQKASFYRIMKYEKWGIFLIVLMVMVIASFSIVGTLVMLVIEKKNDIRTLYNVGGDNGFIRRIFMKEGMLVSSIGAVAGMMLGLLVCGLQAVFGIVKIPARTFLVDSYPIVVQWQDVILVLAAYIAVSYLITKFTVVRMIPRSEIVI